MLRAYQALGIGSRMVEALARAHLRSGLLYYSRTSHERVGRAREASPQWSATPSNLRATGAAASYLQGKGADRIGYAHSFVGGASDRALFLRRGRARECAVLLRNCGNDEYTMRLLSPIGEPRCCRCELLSDKPASSSSSSSSSSATSSVEGAEQAGAGADTGATPRAAAVRCAPAAAIPAAVQL